MPSPVIDLSHHNPEPDWAAIRRAGVVGVIHKATEGKTYVDDTFADRRDRAQGNGVPFLSYHFLKAGSIEAQMRHYLDVVSPVPGERVCIDHEDKATLSELVQAVNYLQAQPLNLQVTIYSGHLIKEQLGSTKNAVLATTSLWIAQYTSAASPSWPKATWPSWSLWQWTDKEAVPGISAPVDGNRWNGSAENLTKWLAPAGSAPAPSPEPDEVAEVAIFTSGKVKVILNGQLIQPQ